MASSRTRRKGFCPYSMPGREVTKASPSPGISRCSIRPGSSGAQQTMVSQPLSAAARCSRASISPASSQLSASS